jgi:hypothetical protein
LQHLGVGTLVSVIRPFFERTPVRFVRAGDSAKNERVSTAVTRNPALPKVELLVLRRPLAIAPLLAWPALLHATAPSPAATIVDTTTRDSDQVPLPSAASSASESSTPARPEQPSQPAPQGFLDRLGINKNNGFFQPSALIQIWGVADDTETSATTTHFDSTFRLRRVELRAKGEVVPKTVAYYVSFDVAKTLSFTNTNVAVTNGQAGETVVVPKAGADTSPLQDVSVTYLSSFADVSVGQFKIPVSLEALQSSAKLLFPERSIVTREYGDRRDIGIRIDKKIGDFFYYYAGIFNGQGQNVTDTDHAKDLALRLEAYPITGLTIGGVAYGTVFDRTGNVRDRLEGDLRYEGQGLIVQGEYIHGWTGPKTRRLEGHGAYGAIGYTILDTVQPVFRSGVLDTNMGNIPPQTQAESGSQYFFEGALNYFLQGSDAKLSLSAAYFNQQHGYDKLEMILQAQAAF